MPGTEYYWYRTKQDTHGEYKAYFHNGVKYLIFVSDPDYETVDKLNLTFVGVGNIDFIRELKPSR